MECIELGLKAVNSLRAYVAAVRNASNDVKAIALDLYCISGVLHRVKRFVPSPILDDDPNAALFKDIATCASSCEKQCAILQDQLGKASREIKNQRHQLNSGNPVQLSSSEKILWPFRDESVERMRRELEKTKSTLNLLFSSLALERSRYEQTG